MLMLLSPEDGSDARRSRRARRCSHIDQVRYQRSFHLNAIHAQQTRRLTAQHRALHNMLFLGRVLSRMESTLSAPPPELFGLVRFE